MANNTIVGNTASGTGGGGLLGVNSVGVLSNNIIRDNTASIGEEIDACGGCTLFIDHSNVNAAGVHSSGGLVNWGLGNIDADALFTTGPLGGFYLCQTSAGQGDDSPCVNAGDPVSIMIDGTTRTDEVQDTGITDMGYHYPLP